MIVFEIVFWASICRGTLKLSTKKYWAGRTTPRYSQNRATDYYLWRNRFLSINVSRHTETVPKNVLSGSKSPQVYLYPRYILWFAAKSSPAHQRVEAHRNSPEKRTQPVEKPPVQWKPSNSLWFRTKSSAGDQHVETHRNSPQKLTQRVEKLPGIFKTELQTMIQDEIVSWAPTCWGKPKRSPKTYSDGRKTPRYSQNWATDYDQGRNCLLGINMSRYTEIVPKKVLSGSSHPQEHSKPNYRLWWRTKSSPELQRVDIHKIVRKNVHSRSRNTQVYSNPSYNL